MDPRERVLAALRGQRGDPPPVALWRHFPGEDQRAESLARAHVAFWERFRFDLLKVTPASGYYGEDWGLRVAYRPNREGVRAYLDRPIKKAADWRHLRSLDVTAGAYGRELRALRLIREAVGPEVPVLATVFSPLTVARTLSGNEAVVRYLRENPDDLHAGLEIITDVTARFAAECLAAGAHGIFFATQMACAGAVTEEEYEAFGRPYDLQVLEAVTAAEILILHLHGEGVYFDLLADYPVHAVNWHDRRTPPSLQEARSRTTLGLAGGIDERTFADRSPAEIAAEVQDALNQTGGIGHVVAPGCVIPVDAPEANLEAAVRAARAGRS
ncbi:MAG: uroporphyrinogen decarboxylase family protein [Armatimonadota bacterium]|nr:uroporphyrinogen decarboxylase family protein [Armatimonadota bacterium]MDR7567565.1 uroporphyrinogen decarboxylase family protein [Armatimonadota bacterium]MDR7602030.1 uroporphyrinogen decarboxylase family protein [Armatimonadota bacterium]